MVYSRFTRIKTEPAMGFPVLIGLKNKPANPTSLNDGLSFNNNNKKITRVKLNLQGCIPGK